MCRTELSGTTDFNPRPPRGGRQPLIRLYNPDNKISIHALREESDQRSTGMEPDAEYFNPRPPRGERHSTYGQKTKKEKFQSTPSARRATYCFFNKFFFKVISIHALREESDFGQTLEGSANIDFNPRPPRGGRRLVGLFPLCRLSISIHALREEGDTCS